MSVTTPINRTEGDTTLTIIRMVVTTKIRSRDCSATVGKNWSSSCRSPAKQFRSRPVGVVSKKHMGQRDTCKDKSNPGHEVGCRPCLGLDEDASYPQALKRYRMQPEGYSGKAT